MEKQSVRLFRNDLEAVFVRRPNRFLIIAKDGNREIPCHCPNPGRLIEFFGFRDSGIPGARLILEERPREAKTTAKTAFTAAGIYYRNAVAPLFSSRANRAAEKLILPRIIPGLREIQAEYTIGASRFDFCCTGEQGARHLIEVKACSLIEYAAAMFPDAPSERALKHLEELAELSRRGYVCHVLFVIVHGKPSVFIPNLHTDPAFAAALSRLGRAVDPPGDRTEKGGTGAAAGKGPVLVHAALLRCNSRGGAKLAVPSVPVDLSHGALAASNRGSYLVLLELAGAAETEVGALGTVSFEAGWYVYAGSAQRNLFSRISRHQRKVRKRKHWHIDYLSPWAKTIKAVPIMSYRNLECELAQALTKLGGRAVPGFGSSDCRAAPGKRRCPSHLYYFADPPLRNRAFVDLLLRFRHREGLLRER
ncbi:MAG: DNA/RNA nuclease SfsA [Treponema sp.]|nr:DNA/RNA nuclease SfsA [Treponema sp.]